MQLETPYTLFLGDAPDALAAKTAIGVYQWRPELCRAQFRLPGCGPRIEDLPELPMAAAAERGCKTVIVGVANRGGVIAPSWQGPLVEAMELGMDLASGLHTRLGAVPALREAAERTGRRLIDVRHPQDNLPIATGQPRSGHRLLCVGTDCSVGKMYTALALERAMKEKGFDVDFRATGQTGILIAGSGVPLDAVPADFIAGAVEAIAPAADPNHWDLIEGQGSLFHPSFAGVSLGLLHGAQADALVLCHEPTREHMRGLPGRPLPGLRRCMELNLEMAQMVNPDVRFVGISINTHGLTSTAAELALARTEALFDLPCVDPGRGGVDRLLEAL